MHAVTAFPVVVIQYGGIYLSEYFGDVKGLSLASLIGTVVTLVLSAFTVRLAERVGKREMSAAGIAYRCGGIDSGIFCAYKKCVCVAYFYGISYIGLAMFNLVCWA